MPARVEESARLRPALRHALGHGRRHEAVLAAVQQAHRHS
eukprot:CAMPEP_0168489044 /NCGR_PEP_ID=MMETSP0228-20121227/68460_1 /TAXON_ID=133427 /ORGANISM="Protoceratium reticulatum, Strain CCCM 535 (=CCMP 1889)" /LENGTH=39 /DNA_ID= /DNA_START= /DNA_END= /DNA_ORIENTATION=